MKIIPLFLIILIVACNSSAKTKSNAVTNTMRTTEADSIRASLEAQKKQIVADMSTKEITHLIINVPDNKFGYYILLDGNIYIEQKTIPAIEGNTGFATKEDAEKVALLVIEKIKEGELPPTVSVEELKQMGIAF
ncbi:MAG TPA: DUF4907 domain-containing protein [Saprospiraceae bacterium]|nr:DUF4907 domain-containing protein [Saprospiraceae bacterium]